MVERDQIITNKFVFFAEKTTNGCVAVGWCPSEVCLKNKLFADFVFGISPLSVFFTGKPSQNI